MSNAERQRRHRAKTKAAKVTNRVPAPKAATPKPAPIAERLHALEVAVALLKTYETRIRDLEDQVEQLASLTPEEVATPTVADLRSRIQTVMGPKPTGGARVEYPPVWGRDDDPGDAP